MGQCQLSKQVNCIETNDKKAECLEHDKVTQLLISNTKGKIQISSSKETLISRREGEQSNGVTTD